MRVHLFCTPTLFKKLTNRTKKKMGKSVQLTSKQQIIASQNQFPNKFCELFSSIYLQIYTYTHA